MEQIFTRAAIGILKTVFPKSYEHALMMERANRTLDRIEAEEREFRESSPIQWPEFSLMNYEEREQFYNSIGLSLDDDCEWPSNWEAYFEERRLSLGDTNTGANIGFVK